jgi:hypothetical protein
MDEGQNIPESPKLPLDRLALDALDKRILQLELSYPSITDQEIADEIGVDRKTVNRRRLAEKYQKAIHSFLAEPIETIKASLQKAARVLVKALESDDEKIRVGAAIKILASEGVLKLRPENGEGVAEPLVIRLPMAKETITIAPGVGVKN